MSCFSINFNGVWPGFWKLSFLRYPVFLYQPDRIYTTTLLFSNPQRQGPLPVDETETPGLILKNSQLIAW